MPAKSVAALLAHNPVERCLPPDLGILSVRRYDKLSLNQLPIYGYSAVGQPDVLYVPEDRYALPGRMPDQELVEQRAPDALCDTGRKISENRGAGIGKANTTEGESHIGGNFDAQFRQRRNAIWHQTFATCLVYGRSRTVHDGHITGFATQSYRCGQTGRAAANDANLSITDGHLLFFYRSTSIAVRPSRMRAFGIETSG
jgi:hypothetical protein